MVVQQPSVPIIAPPVLLFLAMVAGAGDGGLEGVGPVPIDAPDHSVYWFSFHHVAALAYGSDRLGDTCFRARGHRPAFAETAAGIRRHVELYAAGYAYFSGMA